MARHMLVVLSNSVEGADEEFNRWYSEQHLADILRIPGYMSAERYRLSAVQFMDTHPYEYLALYQVETDDLAMTANTLETRPADELPVSDAIDKERTAAWWFTPLPRPSREADI